MKILFPLSFAAAGVFFAFVIPAAAQSVPNAATGACPVRFAEAAPRVALANLVQAEDYPQSALRAGIGGLVRFRVNVGIDGRAENVEIVEAADRSLATATERLLTRRARFKPAVRNCQPIPGEYEGSLRWSVPE